MANIDFPTNVPDGYTFTASNGVIYTYDSSGGGGWTAYTEQSFDQSFVEKAGDTMTGDLTVPSLNGGQLAGFRNLLINGQFEITQRQTLPMTIDTAETSNYSFDRWDLRGKAQTGGDTVISSTYIDGVGKGDFATTGYTSTGYITQKIEASNVRHLSGQQLTLSVYASELPGVTVNWYDSTDTAQSLVAFGTSMNSLGNNRYSVTFTMPSGVNIASAGSQTGLQISFWFANTANPVPDNTYSFWKSQLEPGPVATPFEFRPIQTELALCQRYFYKYVFGGGASTAKGLVYKTAGSTNPHPLLVTYPVTMRVTPEIDLTNTVVRKASGTGATPAAVTASSAGRSSDMAYLGASDLTQNTTGILDFSGYFTVDAEL